MLLAEYPKDYELYGHENRSVEQFRKRGGQPSVRQSHAGPEFRDSDFGIEIKESFQTSAQLLLDFLFAAFEHVHSDVRLPAIGEFYRRLANLDDVFRRQQPHAIYQREICHILILRRSPRDFARA